MNKLLKNVVENLIEKDALTSSDVPHTIDQSTHRGYPRRRRVLLKAAELLAGRAGLIQKTSIPHTPGRPSKNKQVQISIAPSMLPAHSDLNPASSSKLNSFIQPAKGSSDALVHPEQFVDQQDLYSRTKQGLDAHMDQLHTEDSKERSKVGTQKIASVLGKNNLHFGPYTQQRGHNPHALVDALHDATKTTMHGDVPTMMALHNMAEEEFGAPFNSSTIVHPKKWDEAMQLQDSPGTKYALREFLRTHHAETQKLLEKLGIPEATLYRGADLPSEFNSKEGYHAVGIDQSPLSSWSSDYHTAVKHAQTRQNGGVIASTFPKERIVSTPHHGMGIASHGEVITMSGPTDGVAYKPKAGGGYPASPEEFAALQHPSALRNPMEGNGEVKPGKAPAMKPPVHKAEGTQDAPADYEPHNSDRVDVDGSPDNADWLKIVAQAHAKPGKKKHSDLMHFLNIDDSHYNKLPVVRGMQSQYMDTSGQKQQDHQPEPPPYAPTTPNLAPTNKAAGISQGDAVIYKGAMDGIEQTGHVVRIDHKHGVALVKRANGFSGYMQLEALGRA